MSIENKKVLGVIPARIGSTRIPKKMLIDICGKTLIERTIERTKKAKTLDLLILSTDSEEVAELVQALGVPVIMTDPDLPTGTDRVAATMDLFTDFVPDIVVNIWGDEPLFPSSAIDDAVEMLHNNNDLSVVTAADLIVDEKILSEPSIGTVLTDVNNRALIFTRTVLPYNYTNAPFKHYQSIGVLAMRLGFLKKFLTLPRTPIEAREGVEQMRILEHGYKMGVVKLESQSLGVNTYEELREVRKIYEQRESTKKK